MLCTVSMGDSWHSYERVLAYTLIIMILKPDEKSNFEIANFSLSLQRQTLTFDKYFTVLLSLSVQILE